MIEIRKAIAAHGLWKLKLKEVIRTGKAGNLSPREVARCDACDFGRWLATISPALKTGRHFHEVERMHAEFHRAAAEVLTLALSRHLEQALQATEHGGFATSSANLLLILTDWEKELDAQRAAA